MVLAISHLLYFPSYNTTTQSRYTKFKFRILANTQFPPKPNNAKQNKIK